MTSAQVIVPLTAAILGASITATAMLTVARLNRRGQVHDREEEQRTRLAREWREHHAQQFARDFDMARDVLDDLFRVASEIRESPASQEKLEGLKIPEIIRTLDLLGEKLESHPEARDRICLMWERLRTIYLAPMHFDFLNGSTSSLYDRGVVLEYFVQPATVQTSEAVEILHHLEDCRQEIMNVWVMRLVSAT